ncbi:zinc finger CCCH domain-containing protein 3 [Sardina pilchardus]|uniref:zinc finger CCCH domain-containing protein 3 n=1 Tax=Sardina pilchardus TaxID=27697 RepID=UPI002E12327E
MASGILIGYSSKTSPAYHWSVGDDRSCFGFNMEEREALKRQIELLQNLISNHSNGQTSAQQNVAPRSLESGHRAGHLSNLTAGSQPYTTRPAGSWRKTYSLNNRSTADRTRGPAAQLQTHTTSHTLTAPQTSTASQPLASLQKGDSVSVPSVRNTLPASKTATSTAHVQIKSQLHPSTNPPVAPDGPQARPSSSSASSLHANPASPSQPKTVPPSQPKGDSAKQRAATAPLKKSQYHWVKSQQTGLKAPASSTTPTRPQSTSFTQTSLKTAHSSSRTSPLSQQVSSKRAASPSTQTPQRSVTSTGRPRTSKYTWVSHSTQTTSAAKLARKPLSPRVLQALQSLPAADGARLRKGRTKGGAGAAAASQTRLSRYSWRAEGTSPVAKGSVYRWTPQKEKGLKAGALSPSSVASPWGFKLRSRMKIIRRTPNRQVQAPVRTPPSSRRGNRALVSIGRHKLRLVSPSRSVPASYLSGPAVHLAPSRVRTRYRIDARRWHAVPHQPQPSTARSWRTRRVQSARMLLQSRHRSAQERHWRGRRMRWIGGELYQVSANKLSRTQAPGTATNRTGKRLWLPTATSPTAFNLNRTSSSRHVASRVVQRSLAIIRQAQQKKQQARQYCMYYNRFGKCNRGTACPFIHDPEKVAVCTRFLRGTCKQTDGTCPFSHRVSREKMPVCSYYLRGICNNSSCPYSHVYVSRKADVCQDFIRGYCPQGEKCKKKHTLVCADFSATGVCPRGSKCKLKHRLRKTAAASQAQNKTSSTLAPPPPPAKKALAKASSKKPDHSQGTVTDSTFSASSAEPENEEGSLSCTSTPRSLPSFIALPSSPEDGIPPDTPPHALVPPIAKGEKLHIKPRF